ncbi:putative methyltransferase YcgJ [Nocardioides dokdonensis FR1436]|uniref:Putative methyltransferase YcgJ n=1 Tax=Nocardioides dokdonensis FR1436 TaxID=1300347 RepID=A0A1A9GQL6_9ACTN|nr:class I SAM-dependent methyltransferase [Nocardioides dokdonensis]ANH39725.1 putative methyltransferase YcgJ [Nocardioides dokdonensis FR1436]
MSWWEERVLPRLVDRALSTGPVHALRAQVCEGLEGRVLEIGFGSGLNLSHLPAAVTSLDAVEPADLAWSLSESRRGAAAVTVERVGLDGQLLAAPDAAYDAVLCTFSLCTIPDPALAVREVRRVLRPGGRLHVLEHGLAPEPPVRAWQRRLEPVQRRVAGGCHLTRDPFALVVEGGLRLDDTEQRYLPGPAAARPWTYGYLGTATRVG